MPIQLSSVEVIPLHPSASPCLAEARVVLGGQLALEGIKLFQKGEGYRLSWPSGFRGKVVLGSSLLKAKIFSDIVQCYRLEKGLERW